jgi:RNA polymerase sigma-70 factor (ECF subfamily)
LPSTLESSRAWRPGAGTAARAFADAGAERWALTVETFTDSLERAARRAFAESPPDQAELDRFVRSLHLEDLALATACAAGHEPAWDEFVRDYRPILYRAADAIDASGSAREAADSLYGELFGLTVRDGERQSHFRYFHGRSALGTWLRAVLSQRYVDMTRRRARTAPLPADDMLEIPAPATPHDSTAARYVDILRRVVTGAIAALAPRDRLRLRLYHGQDLTLAQIGRVLGEHEATVSRNLTRARRSVRDRVQDALRREERMDDREIAECLAAASADAGPLELAELLGAEP